MFIAFTIFWSFWDSQILWILFLNLTRRNPLAKRAGSLSLSSSHLLVRSRIYRASLRAIPRHHDVSRAIVSAVDVFISYTHEIVLITPDMRLRTHGKLPLVIRISHAMRFLRKFTDICCQIIHYANKNLQSTSYHIILYLHSSTINCACIWYSSTRVRSFIRVIR